jgi:hypothetical protein
MHAEPTVDESAAYEADADEPAVAVDDASWSDLVDDLTLENE